jgi:RNA-directed DNA polymerase
MTDPVSVLAMDAPTARTFLLKGSSYCNFELPGYFNFDPILTGVSGVLDQIDIRSAQSLPSGGFRVLDGVNHLVLNNKDGKLSWRPMSLIHPAIYVDMVRTITADQNWQHVRSRFRRFARNKRIQCLSLPVESQSNRSSRAEQILGWWRDIEQSSIAMSLQFPYVAHTDIVDCYGSIYTHSIAWALHGRSAMKRIANQDYRQVLGGKIDGRLQDMSQAQTNGIPQGSTLMDLIAEMVLGYADLAISVSLERQRISEYQILRYRDDYRIFAESPVVCESILKVISEVHQSLGMKLNASKTIISDDVVKSSVKNDKLTWIAHTPRHSSMQQQLLAIHQYAQDYPNSGGLVRALSDFHKRAQRRTWRPDGILPDIAIVADIAAHSPKTYALSAAIISRLLVFADQEQRSDIIQKLTARFSRTANTGHLNIWLQRITHRYSQDIAYSEPLCRLVNGEDIAIWNNDWISSTQLKAAINPSLAVNRDMLASMDPAIPTSEVQLFEGYPS